MHSKCLKRVLLAGAALVLAGVGASFRLVVVSGSSMQPALTDRQLAVLKRQRRDELPPRRGDIVVFRHGAEYLVKRVYAVAGDTVRLVRFSNGATCVAGDPLFPWAKVERLARARPSVVRITSVKVPAGSVFVLGDNHLVSYDSRAFGAVRTGAIVGRVLTPRQAIASLPSTFASEFGRLS